jgi:hypothetical protein
MSLESEERSCEKGVTDVVVLKKRKRKTET